MRHRSADSFAGILSFVEFDPDDISIGIVHEAVFETISYEFDNDDGWLWIAGAEAIGMDGPMLVEIEFDSDMESGAETEL